MILFDKTSQSDKTVFALRHLPEEMGSLEMQIEQFMSPTISLEKAVSWDTEQIVGNYIEVSLQQQHLYQIMHNCLHFNYPHEAAN